MFTGVVRDEFRAYIAKCHLREACTEASYTLRGAGEGLAAFLIDNTAWTLQTELFNQVLSTKERDTLPFLGEWNRENVVAVVKLYAQKAAVVAWKDSNFGSLAEYPTGQSLELTAESYLDKMYDRPTGNLLWEAATAEGGLLLIHI
jgi:hypothetical protein